MMKKEGKRLNEEECEQYAEERARERIDTIRSEMETVPGGRLDACLAVSQGGPDLHFEELFLYFFIVFERAFIETTRRGGR